MKTIRMTEPSKLVHSGVPDHQPAAGGIAARARAAAGGPKYLAGLNPEQREAVETLEGPVLVLAGAGTGKTRVLTTRIAHILSQGRARPSEILSATFTNGKGGKLYASYQERLKILNAADFGDLLLENIRLFREHPDVLRQYQQRFKFVLVDEYQDTNVAQYLWLRLLAQAPSSLTSPRSRGEVGLQGNPGEGDSPQAVRVEAAPVKDGEREKSAHAATPAPSPPPKNICCVGDDDQSIYGWRGAEVDNILRFEHDFPG